MLLAVRQDAPQLFIECNGPLRCLPHFRDSLLLEHLDQVLLNSCLYLCDLVLLEDWGIVDWRLLVCMAFAAGSFDYFTPRLLAVEEWLPTLFVFEIEAH